MGNCNEPLFNSFGTGLEGLFRRKEKVNYMSKKKRMEDILSLINEFEIETQEELTEKLNQKGYNVSQATVSRDIKDLGIVKSTGFSKKNRFVKFTAREMPAKYVNMYKHAVISITAANNLIVIKTLEGNANSVGAAIDSMLFPQVLGTIAGDDTLLIITKKDSDADLVIKTLRNI